MVNVALVILWVFIVIIIVIVIGFSTFYTIVTLKAKANAIDLAYPPCSESTRNLVDVSKLPCCFNAGLNTTFKYYRNNNITLAPFPTYYLDVCVGFCSADGYDPITDACRTGDSTNFNQCKSLLSPNQCTGNAKPIAADGPTLYYGYQAGSELCSQCCPCGSQNCNPTAC